MSLSTRPGGHECSLQQLEPRVLLSSVAVVGFDSSMFGALTAFLIEADVNDTTGAVTGDPRFADVTGLGPPANPFWDTFTDSANGGFAASYLAPFTSFDNEWGARFDDSKGYTAGWYTGYDDGSPTTDFGFSMLVERPDDATINDIQGAWVYSFFQFDGLSLTGRNYTGAFTVGGSSFAIVATSIAGAPPVITSQAIIANDAEGEYETNNGLHMFLSADKSLMLIMDARSGDGRQSIGVAFRADVDATFTSVAGDYRTTAVTDALAVQQGFDPLDESLLRLRDDGTFAILDLTDYDAGTITITDSGDYAIAGGVITLDSPGVGTASFTMTDSGRVLLPTRLDVAPITSPVDMFGLATRIPGTGPVDSSILDVALPQLAPDGTPQVFERRLDGSWVKVDLLAVTGNNVIDPAKVTQIESFTDRISGRLLAAVVADGQLWVFTRSGAGIWSSRNLSDQLNAQLISSNLTLVQDLGPDLDSKTDDRTTIAAIDAFGDLVFFDQTGSTDGFGDPTFRYTNISDDVLGPGGFATPFFPGPIVSYTLPWNGRAIAGLSASGDIWSIWTTPALGGHWRVSNLSQITGAPPLAGGLTPYIQPWGGTNLAALNIAGEVVVTWWTPGLGGTWFTNNLTTLFTGPTFAAGSTTSWVFSWGGSNIGGLSDSGEVVFFWWAPYQVPNVWRVAQITEPLPPSLPRPVGALHSFVTDDDQANVFGTGAGNELIRLSWEPGDSVWSIENISSLAI